MISIYNYYRFKEQLDNIEKRLDLGHLDGVTEEIEALLKIHEINCGLPVEFNRRRIMFILKEEGFKQYYKSAEENVITALTIFKNLEDAEIPELILQKIEEMDSLKVSNMFLLVGSSIRQNMVDLEMIQ